MEDKYVDLLKSIKPNKYQGITEDDIQEAFIKISKAKPDFSGRSDKDIRNYMLTCITSCKNDRYRTSYYKKRVHLDFDKPLGSLEPYSLNDYMHKLDIDSYWESIYSKFYKVYEMLDEDQRLYVFMRFFRDMSGKEISNMTGQSIEAIKGKMFRMKKYILENYGKI